MPIANALKISRREQVMVDLSTKYMGLSLKNPLVASSSPLSENVDNVKRMQDAGVAAIVMHSLFEEQITLEEEKLNWYLLQGTEHFAEALDYFPDYKNYNLVPDEYVRQVKRVKDVVQIPVIGSLNGISKGGWIRYAKRIEEAGADALELNMYYLPTSPDITSQQVENNYVELLRAVKENVCVPVAVKLNPCLSSIPFMCRSLCNNGADALVLFNRFYQPDIDTENLEVVPELKLSTPDELLLRLRWIAIMYKKMPVDMAITGGVHSARDIMKCIMAGANVSMMTSAILQNGISHISVVLSELAGLMQTAGYGYVDQMRGVMSQETVAEPAAFARANYMKVLGNYAPVREG